MPTNRTIEVPEPDTESEEVVEKFFDFAATSQMIEYVQIFWMPLLPFLSQIDSTHSSALLQEFSLIIRVTNELVIKQKIT